VGPRVPPRAWLDRAGVSSTPPPQVVARRSCSWPGWYRDHLVVSAGAEDRAVHADRLDELRGDAAVGLVDVAAEAAETVASSGTGSRSSTSTRRSRSRPSSFGFSASCSARRWRLPPVPGRPKLAKRCAYALRISPSRRSPSSLRPTRT
jgi:hypothetical protein